MGKSRIDSPIKLWLIKLGRIRSRATFICITGSSGKSTATAMLSHVLRGVAPVHAQVFRNHFRTTAMALREISSDHRFVVCEVGSDGPGTLKPMIDLVRPSVGVVTLVRLEHYSAFRKMDAVAEEKGKLIEALPKGGLAVLNYDDPNVLAMASRTRARVVTFGSTGGDYRIEQTRAPEPGALGVTIVHDGRTFELETKLTGTHNALAAVAAFTCAHQLGTPAQLIQERLASFQPLMGRCSVHSITNGPLFIADTAQAPYHSIYLPIKMIGEFSAPRRRIVVGSISDYAGNPRPKYRDVYRAARLVADQVIFVGETAHRVKAAEDEIAAQRFVAIRTVEAAAAFIKSTAMPGEIILLKGSQNLHLERILLNFDHQVRCWEDMCGVGYGCQRCALYRIPFAEHQQFRKTMQYKRYKKERRAALDFSVAARWHDPEKIVDLT